MTGHTLAAGAPGLVTGVIFESGDMRTIRTVGCVAVETNRCRRLSELRIVLRAVRVMTRRARDAPAIHDALHEIVSEYQDLVCKEVLRYLRDVIDHQTMASATRSVA